MNNDKWIVCPDCDGEGKHALHGIALTQDDIEEAGGEEFLDDYMSGAYDTVCETCKGRTTVRESQLEDYYDRVQEAHTMRMESGVMY